MDRGWLLSRAWEDDALCRLVDDPGRVFYPANDHDRDIGVRVCEECPAHVRGACWTHAVVTGEMDGTRGGMPGGQFGGARRRFLLNRSNPRPCAHCLNVFIPALEGRGEGRVLVRFCADQECARERRRLSTERSRTAGDGGQGRDAA